MHRAEWEQELAAAVLPEGSAYLWRVFLRLRRRAGGTGFGPAPITLGGIADFIRLLRYPLTPWEIEVIEDLDDAYMTVGSKTASASDDEEKVKR